MSMTGLFDTGAIGFLIVAVLVAEAILLFRHARRVPGLFAGLASGACLALGLRSALLQEGWVNISVFLAVAFVFHIVEVRQWLRSAKH